MREIEIEKETLIDLYINHGYSQCECGEILGCSQALISMKMKEYQISPRQQGWHIISKTYIQMTDEMYEVLRGALLGDGYMRKSAVNANFLYSSKSFQHVNYVCKHFINYASNEYIKYRKRYDKRTDKFYEIYEYKSIASPTFTVEYNKWYFDGIKHIPTDLKLTPLMCKVWYLGDGSLINSKNCNSQRLMLYTNGFNKKELEDIILPQLKHFNAVLQKMNKEKTDGTGYAIRIGAKEDIIKFIEYIGKCPFEDYAYKWKVKRPS